jgi:hypothetical protein
VNIYGLCTSIKEEEPTHYSSQTTHCLHRVWQVLQLKYTQFICTVIMRLL